MGTESYKLLSDSNVAPGCVWACICIFLFFLQKPCFPVKSKADVHCSSGCAAWVRKKGSTVWMEDQNAPLPTPALA